MKRLFCGLVALFAAPVAMGLVSKGHDAGCQSQDRIRVSIHSKSAMLDVECEEMCRRIGEYPKCQCPGFDGQPASQGDTRQCMDQHCQDPNNPCPTDAFMTCVETRTKLSALQWGPLFEQISNSLDSFKEVFAKARRATAEIHH